MSDLLPCPKCAGEAAMAKRLRRPQNYSFVNCTQCLLSNDLIADMQNFDEEMARDHWNDRTRFDAAG
jgi:hypothetical protein